MDDNNSNKQVLAKYKKLYEILKDKESGHSFEDRALMVKYLEKKTCPTYFYLEKSGKRSTKKKAYGFRDKRHFFEHMEKFLKDEAERLLELE